MSNFIPRMSSIGVLAGLLLLIIYNLAPQQLPVILLKLAEISLAAFVGYWIDRGLFPYARPHELRHADGFAHAMIRRAIIVGACLVALAVAL